jgi:hypothetical protein
VRAALATWVHGAPRKRSAGDTGATGVSDVRFVRERSEEQRREPTWRTHRSESGVVKRKVHRSPGRGCKLANQGRGASLEEIPVAHEAWVLVVEAVGSRSRSYASCWCPVASRKTSCRGAS